LKKKITKKKGKIRKNKKEGKKEKQKKGIVKNRTR
jgi:hypothetical protein